MNDTSLSDEPSHLQTNCVAIYQYEGSCYPRHLGRRIFTFLSEVFDTGSEQALTSDRLSEEPPVPKDIPGLH